MTKFTLRRLDHTDLATFGQLFDEEEKFLCVTLEEPYIDKDGDGLTDRGVSCIPPGTYEAFRRLSPKRRKEVFELRNVPGRSNIQIHVGNTTADIEGCILLGSAFGRVNGQNGVTGSRVAFDAFMALLRGVDRITLEVVAPPPPLKDAA